MTLPQYDRALYPGNKDAYLELSDVQILKLRNLSLVTLAAHDRVIPYSLMQKEFGIDNTRALEDLIIEAMYSVWIVYFSSHALHDELILPYHVNCTGLADRHT